MALLKRKEVIYKILFLLFVIILLVSCSSLRKRNVNPQPHVTYSPEFNQANYPRLAILVIDHTRRFRRYQGALRQIEEKFMSTALNKGYTVSARSDMDEVLEELNVQKSDITEKEIAEAGHILNVPAILIVNINNVSTDRYYPFVQVQGARYYLTTVSISARLISTELGEVLWISNYTGSYKVTDDDRDSEAQILPLIADVVASGLPKRK